MGTRTFFGFQSAVCFYCDAIIYPGGKRTGKQYPLMTEDHVVPRSRSKGTPNDNVVPCCEGCNNEKAALTLEEYRILKAFRYGYISNVEYKFPGEENENT